MVGISFNGLHLNSQLTLKDANKTFGEIITNISGISGISEKTKPLQLLVPIPPKHRVPGPEIGRESERGIKTYNTPRDPRLYPPATRGVTPGSSFSDMFDLSFERHFILLQSFQGVAFRSSSSFVCYRGWGGESSFLFSFYFLWFDTAESDRTARGSLDMLEYVFRAQSRRT